MRFGRRRQADLFFADLMGERPSGFRQRRYTEAPRSQTTAPAAAYAPAPAPYPTDPLPRPFIPALDEQEFQEAVPDQGRGGFRHEPLGGVKGDNVAARWNVDAATTSGSTIDIVVHLHGYSGRPNDASFIGQKADMAGLDLAADGTPRVRASQPTLALVPRGNHVAGDQWNFDELKTAAAFDALVTAGLTWLCEKVLRLPAGSTLKRGRLTLAAHSGGGAGISRLLLNGLDPDEVICFDSTYGGEEPIRKWALTRISSADASRCGLRVFYTGCSAPPAAYPAGRWVTKNGKLVYESPGSWGYRGGTWRLTTTEIAARRLHHALGKALAQATNGAALANRFRVQKTSVPHNDIPVRYSPSLLDSIAADVPKATTPPAATSRPVCVANDDWLTQPAQKPLGTDPPPARPAESTGTATPPRPTETIEAAYAPPNARTYTRNTSAALFRTPPSPVAVAGATEWPETTTDPDAACERALRAAGMTAQGLRGYAGAGIAALRPIASAFGAAALTELLGRLRYTPGWLARPPHSYNNDRDLSRAFGKTVQRPVLLSMRTLLTVPGHFRELARLAATDEEAYALEVLGWLLMQSLRDEVRTATTLNFWLPASPTFVTGFPAGVTGLSPQATQLIAARRFTDATVTPQAYRERLDAWRNGVAGRMWRLETGRDTSPNRAAGAPFYPDPFTIPASINIAAQRAQANGAWTRRLADVDAGKTSVPLTQCDNSYLATLGLMSSRISTQGLDLRSFFPSPVTAPSKKTFTGLAAVQPAFEAAFQAIADLGWNDLVFETQGMGCFRGKKIAGSAAAARRMSEHSLGIAIDLNAFENGQNTTGAMDPRIVALFEAFRFKWGKRFQTPDPMHFEYEG